MAVFSINMLLTRTDCDAVLVPARRLRGQLAHRDTNLEFDGTEDEARAQIAQAELIGVAAELAATTGVLAALPAGPSAKRSQYEIKEAQLTARQKVLQGRGGSSTSVLERELSEARNEGDLAVVDDFIAQVEAKKASLPA